MRGQLTIEYLFLALIALTLISASLAALIKIKDAGERSYHMELFKSSALDIYNAGEEVCAMGSGNSMKMRAHENVSILWEGSGVRFYSEPLNISFSRASLCEYLPSDASANTEITVANQGGKIEIR